jgi:hypothetical protein
MGAFILLAEQERGDPGAEEGLQLVESLAGGLAEAAAMGIKASRP